ncbi:transmembrane protein 199 [Atheta coriaria]|uniref:transmembrane protein 199 n=1 Tax=Dalotia coriaria TaxID=877792 RepID=UPI0031F3BE90
MIAGPITDAQILYKPSKDLLKFIRTLKVDDDSIPNGVSNIVTTKSKKKSDVEDIKVRKGYSDYPSVLTSSDLDYLNSLQANLDDDVDFEKEPAECTERKPGDKLLNFEDLTWLHKYIEEQNKERDEKDRVYFHKLFQGTEIILPKNEEIERSEELEARCVKLRNQQSNREYKMMTKNVDNTRKHLPEDTISYQMKEINAQLIAVFQFVVSVLTGFLFGFLGIELMIGSQDFGFRLLLGIIGGLIVALAELYFLAKKLNENVDELYSSTAITSNHNNSKFKRE